MKKFKGTEPIFWIYAVAVTILSAYFAIWFWRADIWFWLRMVDEGESNGATLRNAALTVASGLGSVAGFVGIWLAIWRNRTASRQAGTAERGLNNERFQRGAEMLGNANLATRLGGISALARLAQEHPQEYHIQIMNLIGAFVRDSAKDEEVDGTEGTSIEDDGTGGTRKPPRCRPDVEEAVRRAVGERTEEQLEVERRERYLLDLTGANLFKANLFKANLTDAFLLEANLTDANLFCANLFEARLTRANLEGANLMDADITGAKLSDAMNLTQKQLNNALQDPEGKPAQLSGGLIWDKEAAKKRWRKRHERLKMLS